MIRKIRDTLLILAALSVIGASSMGIKAQSITSATPWAFAITGTFANCPAVIASTTQFCFSNTGLSISLAGAAWVPVATGTAAAGVTSITVCNEAGASCGTAQNGAVQLDIPKTATLN